MRLLLDTHALLWFYLGDPQLSPAAQTAIVDPANAKLVSPASFWEVAIKVRKTPEPLTVGRGDWANARTEKYSERGSRMA